MSTYIISAIDTDAGKTVVTGLLAKWLKAKGEKVITMKMAQTGCNKYSEDIEVHRKIMGSSMLDLDKAGGTCPYVFKYAASPHLAASMERKIINEEVISKAISKVEMLYDNVLVEGVGGLMVPINDDMMVIDFIRKHNYPVVLVTSGKLGSINHTLLSFEAMYNRDIKLYGVIYNHYPDAEKAISDDSSEIIKMHMKSYFPTALWAELPCEKNLEELKFDLDKEWF